MAVEGDTGRAVALCRLANPRGFVEGDSFSRRRQVISGEQGVSGLCPLRAQPAVARGERIQIARCTAHDALRFEFSMNGCLLTARSIASYLVERGGSGSTSPIRSESGLLYRPYSWPPPSRGYCRRRAARRGWTESPKSRDAAKASQARSRCSRRWRVRRGRRCLRGGLRRRRARATLGVLWRVEVWPLGRSWGSLSSAVHSSRSWSFTKSLNFEMPSLSSK